MRGGKISFGSEASGSFSASRSIKAYRRSGFRISLYPPWVHSDGRFTISARTTFIILTEERCEHVLLAGDIQLCRDPEDNGIIETTSKGHATYIVTRDDDIKFDKTVDAFLSQNNVTPISIARFLKIVKEPRRLTRAFKPK